MKYLVVLLVVLGHLNPGFLTGRDHFPLRATGVAMLADI